MYKALMRTVFKGILANQGGWCTHLVSVQSVFMTVKFSQPSRTAIQTNTHLYVSGTMVRVCECVCVHACMYIQYTSSSNKSYITLHKSRCFHYKTFDITLNCSLFVTNAVCILSLAYGVNSLFTFLFQLAATSSTHFAERRVVKIRFEPVTN